MSSRDLPNERRLMDTVLAHFTWHGFQRVTPALLQPADAVLHWAGDDVRERAYAVHPDDAPGYVLRVDHTVPVCRHYLKHLAPQPAWLSYGGSAFRIPKDGSPEDGEFSEAGIEILNATNMDAAESLAVSAAMGALEKAGMREVEVVCGDLTVFAAFAKALGLEGVHQARVMRAFHRAEDAAGIVEDLNTTGHAPSVIDTAIADLPEDEARGLATALVRERGVENLAGRSAEAVAERMVSRAKGRAAAPPSSEARTVIEAIVSTAGPWREVLPQLEDLARTHAPEVEKILSDVGRRLEAFSKAHPAWEKARFDPAFGRKLAYYSGLVFEVRSPHLSPDDPVAAGGRYDTLFQQLARQNHPVQPGTAIGAMLRPGRIAKVHQARGNPT